MSGLSETPLFNTFPRFHSEHHVTADKQAIGFLSLFYPPMRGEDTGQSALIVTPVCFSSRLTLAVG